MINQIMSIHHFIYHILQIEMMALFALVLIALVCLKARPHFIENCKIDLTS